MGINGFRAFVYLYDVIVIASSIQEHEERHREVFNRLRQYNLKLLPSKCEFMRREVNYLGHIISEEGIKPDLKRTSCLSNFPVPRNPREVKSFLGLAGYYRKFVKYPNHSPRFSKKKRGSSGRTCANTPSRRLRGPYHGINTTTPGFLSAISNYHKCDKFGYRDRVVARTSGIGFTNIIYIKNTQQSGGKL